MFYLCIGDLKQECDFRSMFIITISHLKKMCRIKQRLKRDEDMETQTSEHSDLVSVFREKNTAFITDYFLKGETLENR